MTCSRIVAMHLIVGMTILSGCSSTDASIVASAAEYKLSRTLPVSSVKVENDPAPQFPDAQCMGPQRLNNTNNVAVTVSFVERYKGEGPNCSAQWARPDETRLEERNTIGSTKPLGCSRRFLTGSACTESRTWTVSKVVAID